jgi:Mrp family chromosome partitioning ATPase
MQQWQRQGLQGRRPAPADAQVDLAMTAQPARPLGPDDGRAGGLAEVQHVIAVSSCKGGAGAGPQEHAVRWLLSVGCQAGCAVRV